MGRWQVVEPLRVGDLSIFSSRTAIEAVAGSWTYRELEKASRGVAAVLRRRPKVNAGKTVCIVSRRNAGLIVAVLGTLRASRRSSSLTQPSL